MKCLSEFYKKTSEGNIIPIRCRHCVNCTINRIDELKFYGKCELAYRNYKGESSSFIRLSYNDVFLPVVKDGKLYRLGELIEHKNNSYKVPYNFLPTLLKSDFDKFFNRLRMELKRKYNRNISYINAGEYGTNSTERSHYHIILFGLSPIESEKFINEKWQYGYITALPVKTGAFSYIAKYLYQDVFGEEKKNKYTNKGIEAPFCNHSKGLGNKYMFELFDKDPEGYMMEGKYKFYPKYIREKYHLPSPSLAPEKIAEYEKKSLIAAQDYVNSERMRGTPIDDRSLYMRRYDVNKNKIIQLVENAL